MLNWRDPITYMRLGNEAVLTRDPLGQLPYSEAKIDNTIAGKNPYAYPATDWRGELFKKSTMNQRANFNVSGGGKVARYYLAAAMNRDNGILNVDKRNNFNNNIRLNTYSLRTNVNINLTKSTEVGIRLSGVFDDYNAARWTGAPTCIKKVVQSNPVLFPAYYPVDDAHRYVQHIMFGNFGTGNYINPYADMVKGYREYTRSKLQAQFEAEAEPGLHHRRAEPACAVQHLPRVLLRCVPLLQSFLVYDLQLRQVRGPVLPSPC